MGEEKNFEKRVKKYLESENAWFLKIWGNGVQRSGIPDLLCCVNGHFLAIELKSKRGTPSDLQLREIDLIHKAGGKAIVLYPSDFMKLKKIVRLLKRSKGDDDE